MLPHFALTYRLLVSFLDVPELSSLASTSGYLATLAADPILQRTRLLVVAPSRLSHSLYGIGPEGSPLRPTVSDLIRRGVMKGLDIERRWRAGLYLYSAPVCILHSFTLPSLTGTLRSLWPTMRSLSSCNAARRQTSYPLNYVVGPFIPTH
jgi:hypothetical protein